MKINVGTTSTPYFIAMSSKSSASIYKNLKAFDKLASLASSSITSFISLHSSDQFAAKNKTTNKLLINKKTLNKIKSNSIFKCVTLYFVPRIYRNSHLSLI